MKTIFLFCLLLGASAFAANPTFQSFDTNAFTANAAANSVAANTSSGNPNALVKQSQLSGFSGPTNGITQAQYTAGLATGTNNLGAMFGDSLSLDGGAVVLDSLFLTLGNGRMTGASHTDVSPTRRWQTLTINPNAAGPSDTATNSYTQFIGPIFGNGEGLTNLNIPASSVTGLLTTTNLAPNTYASFDGNTWLTSTRNGINWTNLIAPPAAGDTNFVVEYPDGSLAPFSFTNLIRIIARGQTNINAGSISATNASGSNFLGGQNWFTNNTAPIVPIATTGSGGSTFTNTLGTRAMLSVPYYLQFSLTGSPCGTFSNRTTGEKYIIGGGAMTDQFITNMILLPPCSPGDVWDGRNESVGTSVTFGLPNIGSAAKWYPVN
jgi:hypothetical protein